MNNKLGWITESIKDYCDCRIFKVKQVTRRAEGERKGNFFVLDSPNWVTVIPVLQKNGKDDSFIMVRQYRHGNELIMDEFPAGLIDEGETPEAAAARELLEETGCKAGKLTKIGCVNPNPAFMNNFSWTFLAEDLEKVAEQDLDEHEMIEVIEMTCDEVRNKIHTPSFYNAIIVQALYWFERYRGLAPGKM